jgi:hypothetical protein
MNKSTINLFKSLHPSVQIVALVIYYILKQGRISYSAIIGILIALKGFPKGFHKSVQIVAVVCATICICFVCATICFCFYFYVSKQMK